MTAASRQSGRIAALDALRVFFQARVRFCIYHCDFAFPVAPQIRGHKRFVT